MRRGRLLTCARPALPLPALLPRLFSQALLVSCAATREMAPKLKLLYFDIHGMAARIRTAALVGGVPFEDYRFASRDEFTAMKTSGELPFGQVPLLVVNDGEAAIPQSGAILRYVCTLGGLHPTDALQAAAVDAALDQERDAFASYVAAKCVPNPRRNAPSAGRAADVPRKRRAGTATARALRAWTTRRC